MILKFFRHPVMFSARSALPCNLLLNPCAIHRANSEGPREQLREEGGDTTRSHFCASCRHRAWAMAILAMAVAPKVVGTRAPEVRPPK